MRCREVEALWDEIREIGEAGAGMPPLRESVLTHLRICQPCQDLYEQYEGVAYCLEHLPLPEPSCDLTRRVVEHIASIALRRRAAPVTLVRVSTPIGRLYVGFKETRIAFIGLDRGELREDVQRKIEQRLRRPVAFGEAPAWLQKMFDDFFQTWRVDETRIDISDLTPFEQAALRAAAQIPRGEVRSYAWVARTIGRPRAARAVGQVMARNPLPFFFPCHRVVDSSGGLHNYGYGIEMKARLLEMEGYHK